MWNTFHQSRQFFEQFPNGFSTFFCMATWAPLWCAMKLVNWFANGLSLEYNLGDLINKKWIEMVMNGDFIWFHDKCLVYNPVTFQESRFSFPIAHLIQGESTMASPGLWLAPRIDVSYLVLQIQTVGGRPTGASLLWWLTIGGCKKPSFTGGSTTMGIITCIITCTLYGWWTIFRGVIPVFTWALGILIIHELGIPINRSYGMAAGGFAIVRWRIWSSFLRSSWCEKPLQDVGRKWQKRLESASVRTRATRWKRLRGCSDWQELDWQGRKLAQTCRHLPLWCAFASLVEELPDSKIWHLPADSIGEGVGPTNAHAFMSYHIWSPTELWKKKRST